MQALGNPSLYINSFFFWMDIVGAFSVPLDHSAVNDSLPRNFDNAVVMRAARTARLGARAGRFTKLVKLLRFLPGVHQKGLGSSGGGSACKMCGIATGPSNRSRGNVNTCVKVYLPGLTKSKK